MIRARIEKLLKRLLYSVDMLGSRARRSISCAISISMYRTSVELILTDCSSKILASSRGLAVDDVSLTLIEKRSKIVSQCS